MEPKDTTIAITQAEKLEEVKHEEIRNQKKENVKLIYAVLKYVKFDRNATYLHDIQSLDFSNLSHDLDGMPIEICRKKLRKLLRPLRKEKHLFQVLSDTHDNLSKEYIGKCKGFNLFIIAKANEINKKLKERKKRQGNPAIVAKAMWNKLTDKEKLAYEGVTVRGKSPIDIYCETLLKKNCSMNILQAKSLWRSLPTSEREKYIKRSAQIKFSLLEDKDSDKKISNIESVLGPSAEDIEEYLTYLGMPEEPNESLHLSYLKKCGEYDDKMHNVKRAQLAVKKFSQLPLSEQTFWKSKHEKVHRKYEKSFNRWKENLDEVDKFILKLFHQGCENKSMSTEKKKLKSLDKFKTVVMPYIKMDFEFSPSNHPPFTPLQVYKHQEKEKGRTIGYNDARKEFSKLSKIDKDGLKIKGEDNMKEYKEKLKAYVWALSEEYRRYFLGFNRIDLMKELKEDVFEEDFPDSLYPIFLKQKQYTVTTELKNASMSVEKMLEKFPKSEKNVESAQSDILDKLKKKSNSSVDGNKFRRSGSYISDIDKNKSNYDITNVMLENDIPIFTENSKRKKQLSSEITKRMKFSDNEIKSPVKIDPTSDSEEENDHSNIQRYINSLEFKYEETKLDDIKVELELYDEMKAF